MVRVPRQRSSSGIYHVTQRGSGRQLIFEDDADRRLYLGLCERFLTEAGIGTLAWCLMDNHVHLLLEDEEDVLSRAMQRLATTYARHYNDRTGHVGHLFQERFGSSPVETESHLLEAVRYIHNNPEAAGECAAEKYEWSSYRDYMRMRSEPILTVRTEVVMGLLGEPIDFAEFVAASREGAYRPPGGLRVSNEEAGRIARHALGGADPAVVKTLAAAGRNEALLVLKEAGLSIRQIERLTGVGRGTVSRA